MKQLLTIFLTFLKIGAFTFGGGYAMIPLIQKEAVENHKWVTDEDILNVVAIAESTPALLPSMRQPLWVIRWRALPVLWWRRLVWCCPLF